MIADRAGFGKMSAGIFDARAQLANLGDEMVGRAGDGNLHGAADRLLVSSEGPVVETREAAVRYELVPSELGFDGGRHISAREGRRGSVHRQIGKAGGGSDRRFSDADR